MPRGIPNNAAPISAEASNKVINDRISKLRKQMVSTDSEIQEIIVLGVTHSMGIGNGDVTWAGRLVNAIPKTYRRALVKNYLDQHTMIRFTADKDVKGNFKASVKDQKQLEKINADRASLPEDKNPFWLRAPISWEHTKMVVSSKYADDHEDESLRGRYEHPFFEEPAVEREPELYTSVAAEQEFARLIERLGKRIKDPKASKVAESDVPALRGLYEAMKRVDNDFKLGKIKGVNDDNKLIDLEPMNRSTPLQNDDTVTRRTGTDG